MRKPRLFIASSVESLSIAEAVNVNLDHEFEVTIWKNGTFKLSSTTVEDLVEKSSSVDFAGSVPLSPFALNPGGTRTLTIVYPFR